MTSNMYFVTYRTFFSINNCCSFAELSQLSPPSASAPMLHYLVVALTKNNCSCTTTCVSANCTAGQYLDATNNVCINCKQSFYQPEKWQTECKPCLNDKITDGEGKTSESDCVSKYLWQEWKYHMYFLLQSCIKL